MKKLLYVLIAFLFVTLNVESVKANTLEKTCYYSYKDNNGVETKYTLEIYRSSGETSTKGTITLVAGKTKNNSENINNWSKTDSNGYNPSETYNSGKICPPYIYIKDNTSLIGRFADVKATNKYQETYKSGSTVHYYLKLSSSNINANAYPKGEYSELTQKENGVVYWKCKYLDSISNYTVSLFVYSDGTYNSKVTNKPDNYMFIPQGNEKVDPGKCPTLWMNVGYSNYMGNIINTYTAGGSARNEMELISQIKTDDYSPTLGAKQLYKTCPYEIGSGITKITAQLKIYSDYTYEFTANGPGISANPSVTPRSLNSYECPTLSYKDVGGVSYFELNSTDSTYEEIIQQEETVSNAYTEYIEEEELRQRENLDNSTYEEQCGYLENSELLGFLQTALNIIKIAGPVLAIVLGMLDFAKAILASDADKELKTAWKHFVYRLIAAALLFLIPAALSFLMNILIPERATDNPYCDIIVVD